MFLGPGLVMVTVALNQRHRGEGQLAGDEPGHNIPSMLLSIMLRKKPTAHL